MLNGNVSKTYGQSALLLGEHFKEETSFCDKLDHARVGCHRCIRRTDRLHYTLRNIFRKKTSLCDKLDLVRVGCYRCKKPGDLFEHQCCGAVLNMTLHQENKMFLVKKIVTLKNRTINWSHREIE